MTLDDADVVRNFLNAARRRVDIGTALVGGTIGFGVATLLTLVGWPIDEGLQPLLLLGTLAGVGGAIRRALVRRANLRSAALRVEAKAPECRNLLVTASELLAGVRVETHVAALVYRQAAALTHSLALESLLPSRVGLLRLVIAALCWGGAVTWRVSSTAEAVRDGEAAGPPTIRSVTVTVTPPSYLGLPSRELVDPTRVEVVRGSRVALVVHAIADSVLFESLGDPIMLSHRRDDFVGEVTVTSDGFLALEPRRHGVAHGDRRLIGITALEDRPPQVVIRTPGRDLHVPDAARTVAISIDAEDDFALASLRLRATIVSGSGERFSFAERDVPISFARRDAKRWTASTSWQIASLGLEPGDMVVYRAVATDRRPGAPPVESDAWIIEITAPGSVAASGFEIDPEQNRYALSQQMVILKTERLLAGRARLSAELFADSAAQIAMEQRRVRAEFVFMMGGEVDDGQGEEVSQTDLNEVKEAEGEDELAAGRLLNAGRLALVRGIRDMSRAATLLGTDDVPGALVEERKALAEIEKAFSHSRIILRALTQREALDPTRRLSGALTDAGSTVEPAATFPTDAKVVATRRLLSALTALDAKASRASVMALAETALRVDPSDPTLQQVAARLTAGAEAVANGRVADATRALDEAATALSAMVARSAPRAQGGVIDAEARRLRGRLSDALRTSVPRPR